LLPVMLDLTVRFTAPRRCCPVLAFVWDTAGGRGVGADSDAVVREKPHGIPG